MVRAVQTSGERATYVPITPARVLDTRLDVGAPDILDANPVLLTVTGTVPTTEGTKTVVPTGASGVVVNITAVNPSVNGFVSLRPGDATGEPKVSTLNVTAGGTFPNGATLTLPASGGAAGQVQIWFEGDGTGGRTDMLIDVVGYYTDHNHDDRYYTKTEVDSALTARANNADVYTRTQIDTALSGKASNSSVYSRFETEIMLSDATGMAVSRTFPSWRGEHTRLLRPGPYLWDLSMVVGWNGLPVISFTEIDGVYLLMCEDIGCDSTTELFLGPGLSPALALNKFGRPMVVYSSEPDHSLVVHVCEDEMCSSSTQFVVDDSGTQYTGMSISIGLDGRPVIVLQDVATEHLKVAFCSDWNCPLVAIANLYWEIGRPDSTVAPDGSILIAGPRHDVQEMNFVRVDDCSYESPVPCLVNVESLGANNHVDYGDGPDISIGSDGNPVIVYVNRDDGETQLVHCQNPYCTTKTSHLLSGTPMAWYSGSLVIGPSGNPITAHWDGGSVLYFTLCSDVACSTSIENTLDLPAWVPHTSMAIGPSGLPYLAFIFSSSGNGYSEGLYLTIPWWLTGNR